tara:strand:+ start:281 stop:1525 length:1245 start_codon:yes stop_codon:yes gene_type:complete
MFSSSLLKYNYIRKKYFLGQNYDISSFELFELILTKKINKPRFNFFEFLINLISLILSTITILKCKLFNLNKINYYIVFKNDLSDPRSNNINSIFKSDKNINIIKTSGLGLSLLAYFKIKNVILHESIVYFSRFFFTEKKFTLKEKFKNIHRCKKRQNLIYFKIFKFLKIRKLLMIDDYREIQNFINICKKLNIETIGYMHSRFSKYRVSLRYDCFDKFIVWTKFFKKKLIEINPKYKNKILINNFRNFKRISSNQVSGQTTVLFFSDTMMDYKSVINYLNQLKRKNIKVLVRLKSNQNENKYFLSYLKENNFINANEANIEAIVKKYKPKFFMATNSNVLLEATLYNCFPIILKTKNDYSFDLIKDNVAICYSGKSNFHKFLKNLENKKNLLNDIYNKIWNSKYETKHIKGLF